MFSTLLRQAARTARVPSPFTTTLHPFHPFPQTLNKSPHNSKLFPSYKNAAIAAAPLGFNPDLADHLIDSQPPPQKTQDQYLEEILGSTGESYEADPQQRAILSQLMDKYGLDSDECKEFTLTTSDLSPADEIRMLSPCGIEFTNSIYFSILFHRFGLGEEADQKARQNGLEYERCLVSRAGPELDFWNKAREATQMHSGWVQASRDNAVKREKEEMRQKMSKQLEGTSKQAEDLEKVAKKRLDLD